MNLITFEQAKEIDSKTIKKGLEEKILMGLASQSAFITMLQIGLISDKFNYIFICGNGNNGGDGLALAYLMLGSNLIYKNQIHIFLKDEPKSDSAKFYFQLLIKNHLSFKPIEQFLNHDIDLQEFQKFVIIEALLGTGQKNLPRSPYKEILENIQNLKRDYKEKIIHIALDIPAGLSEEYESFDEKEFLNFFNLPIPDYIFNFGLKKLVLVHPLIYANSKIYILPCGFDPEEQNNIIKNHAEFIEWQKVNNFNIFKKQPYEHKYQSGYGWLFAGSNNMEGAAILSAKSFFYSGGGILHLIHFSNKREYFLNNEPSIIFHHIDEWNHNYKDLKLPKCIVIGPGLSKNDLEKYKNNLINFLEFLINHQIYPMIVLDAYATTLVLEKNYPDALKPFTILTPHLGEWKQLLKGKNPYLASNWKQIIELHKELGTSILIKGSISFFLPSIYFEGNSKVYVWSYQNPHLSVAGSGDVLTGLILSYFSKITEFSFNNLIQGINTILSLQNQLADFHSTAFEQIKNLVNVIYNK